MRVALALLIAALLGALGACVPSAAFDCTSSDQCARGGSAGRCEPVGYCSFEDTACTTGYRFGEHAAGYSGQCVGAPGSDASVADARPDGASDAPAGCPAGYAALAGAPGHLYRKLPTAAGWTNHATACTSEGANVQLAVPDDTAELDALITLAAADVWIGITDTATEGTFLTVLGAPPAILPWAPGEPDNSANQDCVAVIAASSQFETLGCGTARIAVCECVP